MKKTFSACPYLYPLLTASPKKIQKGFIQTLTTGKNSATDRLWKSLFTTKWDVVRWVRNEGVKRIGYHTWSRGYGIQQLLGKRGNNCDSQKDWMQQNPRIWRDFVRWCMGLFWLLLSLGFWVCLFGFFVCFERELSEIVLQTFVARLLPGCRKALKIGNLLIWVGY